MLNKPGESSGLDPKASGPGTAAAQRPHLWKDRSWGQVGYTSVLATKFTVGGKSSEPQEQSSLSTKCKNIF